MMTLRRFIDVGFAVLVEERLRQGQRLHEAIDEINAVGEEPVPEAKKIDNAHAANQLMAMMGGVRGAPVR